MLPKHLHAHTAQNFFSTNFVHQEQHGDSYQVAVSSNAWLFAAIAVPLTVFTQAVWWVWARIQANRLFSAETKIDIPHFRNFPVLRKAEKAAQFHEA